MKSMPRSTYLCALAVVLAVSSASHVIAQERPAAPATALSRVRIDNFGQISPSYFRGSQPEGGDYADLAALGVKTVIDLQEDGDPAEPRFVEDEGMKFFRIPMTTHTPPTSEQLAQFLQIVSDPASQPVYVHCAGGRHRTGVMTAVYRMTRDGWSPDRAFGEMKQYKFGAEFLHPEFKKFVYEFRSDRAGIAAAAPAAAPVASTSVVSVSAAAEGPAH